MSSGIQIRAIPPTTVMAQIHFHPEDPNGKNPRPYPRQAAAPRMKNGPVKWQWTRPHREALSRHSVPMKPRDAVHKTVLQTGDTAQPRANANHGRHQKRKPLVPLHSRSRCGSPRPSGFLIVVSRPNESKMSDSGRERVLLGVKVWNSSQTWKYAGPPFAP